MKRARIYGEMYELLDDFVRGDGSGIAWIQGERLARFPDGDLLKIYNRVTEEADIDLEFETMILRNEVNRQIQNLATKIAGLCTREERTEARRRERDEI